MEITEFRKVYEDSRKSTSVFDQAIPLINKTPFSLNRYLFRYLAGDISLREARSVSRKRLALAESNLPSQDSDALKLDTAEEERLEKVHACKIESIGRTESCIKSAVGLHALDSKWCSAAKWLGGAIGLAGGWAYYEGEGAGAVLLGGAGLVIYQKGDDCQTDMDRVLTASTAICTTNQARRDLDCDAIK